MTLSNTLTFLESTAEKLKEQDALTDGKLRVIFAQKEDETPSVIGIATTDKAASAIIKEMKESAKSPLKISVSSCISNSIEINGLCHTFDFNGELENVSRVPLWDEVKLATEDNREAYER